MKVAAVEARGVLRGDRRGVSRRIPLRQPAEDEGRLHCAQTRDKKLKVVHDQRPLDALRAQIVQCIRVCVCVRENQPCAVSRVILQLSPLSPTHLKNNAICCNEQVIMICLASFSKFCCAYTSEIQVPAGIASPVLDP